MDGNKSVRVSLGTVICIFIILILVFLLILMYYFGFTDNRNETEQSNNINNYITNEDRDNVNSDNTTKFKPENYIIQFDANLLGEEFEASGNEIKECNYEVSFLDNNKFTIYMGFGNYIEGTYTISNNIINCALTSMSGEYSPIQEIDGKISFRINNDSEIEIIDIPESYTIRLSEASDNGLVLTDKTKEMTFWPLVEGIKYISDK